MILVDEEHNLVARVFDSNNTEAAAFTAVADKIRRGFPAGAFTTVAPVKTAPTIGKM